MRPLPRPHLADQAAAALREEIRSGRLAGFLPGSRPLARLLGINPLTLAEAVKRLLDDGWLESAGPRKRFRIPPHDDRTDDASASRSRSLWFLTHGILPQVDAVALQILSSLLMARRTWNIGHRSVPFFGQRALRRTWDDLLRTGRPDHLIVFSGHPELATWACSHRIPTLFLGGDPGDEDVPILGVDASAMIRTAADKLLALGHRRICIPFCGHSDGFTERQREVLADRLATVGHPFVPSYHTPVVEKENPAAFLQALHPVFSARPPTAFILFDFPQFLTVAGLIHAHGLRLPQDVSVVLLSEDRLLPWALPRPSHFRFPVGRVAQTASRWIERGPPDPRARVSLPMVLDDGETLAPAPPGK